MGLVFSVLAVVLLALGAGFWSARRKGPEVPVGGGPQVKGTLHLETFVLNLADPGQRSYLRVGIDLGLGRELGRGENAPPVGPVRDTIVGVLAQSRVGRIADGEGQNEIERRLAASAAGAGSGARG